MTFFPRLFALRYFLLFFILLSCILLWPGVKKALQADNSLKVWFLKDDPAIIAYNEFHKSFGNDESLVLLVKDSNTTLSSFYFNAFVKMTEALTALPEVEGVLGPGNIQIPPKGTFNISSVALLGINSNPDSVRKTLQENPFINRQCFTSDYKAARFIVMFKSLPDFEDRRDGLIGRVKTIVKNHLPEERTFFGGVGVIFSGLNALSQSDFALFLGLGYMVMFLLILVIYRNFYLLVFSLSTIIISTYLTLGLYGLFGHQLNLMTTLIPTILILIGILDIIHIANEHQYQKGSETDPKATTIKTLQNVFKPCFFTSLTTVAGFLSLLISPMAILQDFGLYTGIGILLLFVVTYILAMIFLPIAGISKQTIIPASFLIALVNSVTRNTKIFGSITVLLILFSVAGIFRLSKDTYTLGYFPKKHKVVLDHQEIEQTWGAYMPMEILVTPHNDKKLYSPEVVQNSIIFRDSSMSIAGISSAFGFVSLYEEGIRHQYGNRSQQVLKYKSGLALVHKNLHNYYSTLTRHYIDPSTGKGRITIFGPMVSAEKLNLKKDSIMAIAKGTLGKVATIKPAGYLPMYASIVNYATSSMTNSLLIAFLFIFILLTIFLRSIKYALLSMLPNLFPVLLLLGVMGWFGVDLDIATASIGAIAMGLCIDDTIHFIYHYRLRNSTGSSGERSREITVKRVGPAIFLTSLILLIGHLLMLFASLKTVFLFGLLISIAVVGGLYSVLVIFPLLLEKFDTRRR